MSLWFSFLPFSFLKFASTFCLISLLFAIESNGNYSPLDTGITHLKPSSRVEKTKFVLQKFSNNSENVLRYNRQLTAEIENRFHINGNTIIRTGESKVLGAKYLNETVLPSNHDCMIWCLETPTCNAVVFEEKMVRSCYMFNCGTPDSYLCKFTKHDFFTSSVLKVSQHSYDLSQWGNQVKHEKELINLKTSDTEITSISPPELKTVQNTQVVTHSLNVTKPGNKCHHYQFQCVNNSECIAIYNVCDGIPQCADESDESPDLKCHMKEAKETGPVPQKPSVDQPPDTPDLYSTTEMKTPSSSAMHSLKNMHVEEPVNKQSMQPMKSGSRRVEKPQSIWPDGKLPDTPVSNPDYFHRTDESNGLGSPFVHKHSQFVAANDARVQGSNPWPNDYDQYPSHSVSLEQQYNPYDGNYPRVDDQYLPNPMSPEYDSVKGYGNYRQEEVPYWPNQDSAQDGTYALDEYSQSANHGLGKSNNYPDKESLYAQQMSRNSGQYPESKHRIIHKPLDGPSGIPKNRASDIDEFKSRRFPLPRQQPPSYMAYEEALQKQLQSGYGETKPKHYEQSHNMEDSMYNNNDDLLRASLVNQLPMELERSHPYQYEKHMEKSESPESVNKDKITDENGPKKFLLKESASTAKPTTHPKPVQKTVFDFKMSVKELYQASRTHSQEANSAILALVMGLTITVLLLVFLSYRIKTIRKRMSRKGRALAHDADYLVNGMYL